MPLELAVSEILGAVVSTGRELPPGGEAALDSWARRLFVWLAGLTQEFEGFAVRLWQSIVQGDDPEGRVRDSIEKQLGPAGETMARQAWSGVHAETELETMQHPASVPVFPYLEYRTQRDDRVRPNHAALDSFVGASNWRGWPRVEPPNGWRCRCRLLPISYREADSRGWSGAFPAGTTRLERFLELGGPDQGFPKSDFQF